MIWCCSILFSESEIKWLSEKIACNSVGQLSLARLACTQASFWEPWLMTSCSQLPKACCGKAKNSNGTPLSTTISLRWEMDEFTAGLFNNSAAPSLCIWLILEFQFCLSWTWPQKILSLAKQIHVRITEDSFWKLL